MKITFDYFQKGNSFYPLIDVAVKEQSKKLKVKALVDSGASYSVFRSEVAEFLGLDIEKGRKMYLEGVGGRILGYLHTLLMSADGVSYYRCKVVFSKEFTVSFNLLGRDNFFYPYLVTFNEKQRKIILENHETV